MLRPSIVLALVLCSACASEPRSEVETPSVVLIVVDTLRADFLEAYGHPRSSMPEVQRRLVSRGVTFERAFAPASWTLPSMVGLFSGRRPGRDLGASHPAAFRFPDERPTPAELFAAKGHDTAAFVGNPLLGPATGFDRGFSTFWVAESDARAMERHGGELTDRALAWLETRSGHPEGGRRPFFLWLHYIDPHDPYEPPLAMRGLDPVDPTYRGSLTGRDAHALFAGRRSSTDPARDARFLASLYEGEIRSVDREIGRLLEALTPELRSTVVLLTSDHGEELYDHGGWKHGRTVYEEQLRVPLVVRWDGELRAGQRVSSAVSLLDIVPTLAEILDLDAPTDLDGESLLLRTRGDDRTERVFAGAHFHTGPLRPSARLGRHKLVLFDRDAPIFPESPLDAHLLSDERARLPRLALFDLDADPAEQQDLSGTRPELVDQLTLLAFDGLDRPGRQVVVLGLEAGVTLRLELALDGASALAAETTVWERLFLGPDDIVRFDSGRLEVIAVGDGLPKALVLPPGALPAQVLGATTDSPATLPVLDGQGQAPVLRGIERPVIATWIREDQGTRPSRSRDPELERTLRSLGYTQ